MQENHVPIIELDFREINKTVKLWPVNLSEKRRDIVGVHQRAADSTKIAISLPFVTTRPLKCNDRVINGLFHTKKSKCLDVHADEKCCN